MASAASICLRFTHSVLSVQTEKRFDPDTTVGTIKEKMYTTVGTAPGYQVLQLRDKDGNTIRTLSPDEATLSALGVPAFADVHILDVDPHKTVAQFTDVSQVKKYEISEESYAKRKDNFRNFKQTFLKDKVAAEEKAKEVRAAQEEKETEASKSMSVGQRCQIGADTRNPHRGVIMFVGPVSFQTGVYVGVKLDEPYGKNDGSVKGKRYFTCPAKYGVFVRPTKLQVGDFPEIDALGSDFDTDEDDDQDVMKEI